MSNISHYGKIDEGALLPAFCQKGCPALSFLSKFPAGMKLGKELVKLIGAAYIHIPFCTHICHYCDFNKVFLKGQPVDEYLDALKKEIEMTLAEHPAPPLKSVFVGGGTPTSLNEDQLEKLCRIIVETLPVSNGAEFTFEANPGDLTEEKGKILHSYGVNRISLGVQTFNGELLKKIGRAHRPEHVFQTVDILKKLGFANINIDLIYGLPGQTLDDFLDTLDKAFSLNIHHFSAYSLIIEPKTVFYQMDKRGELHLPGEDAEAEMYECLLDKMEEKGYYQYEISNFSLPGYESKHNLTYWNNDEYYGFGAGAHSYVDGARRSNIYPVNKYINQCLQGIMPIAGKDELSKKEKMEEEMFLGLRKKEGVNISRFVEKFGDNPLELFSEEIEDGTNKGMLEIRGNNIALTRRGMLLGNEVFQSFINVL